MHDMADVGNDSQIVEETLPPTGGAAPASAGPVVPVGQVQSRMGPPTATGAAPVTSNMPPVVSTMPPVGYAPPVGPVSAPPTAATPPEDREADAAPATTLRSRESVTSGQVCAAAIGMLFGRDPSAMQVVSDAGGLTRIKYRRADQTTWTNECRVTDRTVTWRAIGADGPGRWRTEDEITYSASTSGLAMTVNGETRAFAR